MSGKLEAHAASGVWPKAVTWVWGGFIPQGMVTLMVGWQGIGKSTFTCFLAAEGSKGTLAGSLYGTPFATLLVSLEDDEEVTIVPRLIAAEADRSRVQLIRKPGHLFSLPEDVEALGELAAEHDARLIVIDPLSAALTSATDSHRDEHVRRDALSPLAAMAARRGLAVLGLRHFTKAGEANAMNRISGSLAWSAGARSVIAFGLDPDDEHAADNGARMLAHPKCNVGPQQKSLSLKLVPATVFHDGESFPVARCVLAGGHRASANALFGGSGKRASDTAADWIKEQLAAGPMAVNDIRPAAEAAGLSWETVRKAGKDKAGAVATKTAENGTAWEWTLPAKGNAEEGHTSRG